MTETGMSIFEHSLAFAEAEAMLSNRLGLTLFGSIGSKATTPDEVTKLFTKSEILEKMNTPPEVCTFLGRLIPICITFRVIAPSMLLNPVSQPNRRLEWWILTPRY